MILCAIEALLVALGSLDADIGGGAAGPSVADKVCAAAVLGGVLVWFRVVTEATRNNPTHMDLARTAVRDSLIVAAQRCPQGLVITNSVMVEWCALDIRTFSTAKPCWRASTRGSAASS